MILIVGARGRLGGAVTRRLLAAGQSVRAMTRTPSQLADLAARGAEVVAGDLRDPASLARACSGVDRVLAAAHAFDGAGANVPATVDDAGNRALVDAARAAGVEHVVFTSIQGARADHPIDIWRDKARAETYLSASGLSHTILRPSAFMELWTDIVGTPIVRQGRAMIFGRGTNPINFVAVADVARYAVFALDDPRARGQIIEVGGPDNVSLLAFARMIERALGRAPAAPRHIPLAMMRVMGVVARPVNPAFARQVRAGVLMDTTDMSMDPGPTLRRFPLDAPELTRLEDVVARRYGAGEVTIADTRRDQSVASANGTPT